MWKTTTYSGTTAVRFLPCETIAHLADDFSSELAQILTGQELPGYVQTRAQTEAVARSPIGAQLLSQFAGPRGAPAGAQQPASSGLNALLGDMAARATEPEADDAAADDPATHGIENITSTAQFTQLQQKSACAAVLFTSSTCPPCRIVEPIFEELASAYHPSALTSANPNTKRMRFARVSCDSLGAQEVMSAAQVTATPTLLTYTFGRQAGQVRGADVAEMRTQVNLALFEVYPPHPHASHRLSSRASLPQQPVRVANMPDFARLLGKIDEAAAAMPEDAAARIADARRTLADSMVPHLAQEKRGRIAADEVRRWNRALETYLDHSVHLAPLFPLVDLWRIAVLEADIVQHLAADRTQQGTSVDRLAKRAADELTGGAPAPVPAPAATRALWLTSLRLLANALAAIPPGAPAPILSTPTALSTDDRSASAGTVATLLSEALLHPEDGVRAVAAATAFNAACSLAAGRVDWMRRINAQETAPPSAALAEYETQLACALIEALNKETTSHTTGEFTSLLATCTDTATQPSALQRRCCSSCTSRHAGRASCARHWMCSRLRLCSLTCRAARGPAHRQTPHLQMS